MANKRFTDLVAGTAVGTDVFAAVDMTADVSKKYTRAQQVNFSLSAMGLTTYDAVSLATAAALTATYDNGTLGVGATLTNSGAQAALSIDSVAVAVADRILVKDQAAPAQNGIYVVTVIGTASTNWVLTRATDYDEAAEVIQYGVVLCDLGATNAGLLWQETGAGPFTMGTTSIVFSQFSVSSVAGAAGGSNTQIQYNNAGALGGDSGFTTDGAGTETIVGQLNVDNLRIDGNTLSSTDTNGDIVVATDGTGTVHVGSATAALPNTELQVAKDATQATMSVCKYTTADQGALLYLMASRSATVGGVTTVGPADILGNLYFSGTDGTSISTAAAIRGGVDGTVSAGVLPGALEFYTTTAGGAQTLGMTLDKAQVLTLANALPVTSGGTGLTSTTANQILYSSATNAIAGLASANNGMLVTDGSGVPSIGSTMPASMVASSPSFLSAYNKIFFGSLPNSGSSYGQVITFSFTFATDYGGGLFTLELFGAVTAFGMARYTFGVSTVADSGTTTALAGVEALTFNSEFTNFTFTDSGSMNRTFTVSITRATTGNWTGGRTSYKLNVLGSSPNVDLNSITVA